MNSPLLLTGIGLRHEHHQQFLQHLPAVAWVEIHSENFFADGGETLNTIETIRKNYPVSLHGVNMSLGSTDAIDRRHLNQLKRLITLLNPCLVSDHLAWTSYQGQYFHDLLPLPFTEECLQHLTARINEVQDFLSRQILIENISQYLNFEHTTIAEAEFLNQLAKQTGCGILLDINNIYVSATNLNFDPYAYIDQIEASRVQEFHLAGFSTTKIDGREILIDSHNNLVVNAVWDLFRYTLRKIGRKPTLIEWDADLPDLAVLYDEAKRADALILDHHAVKTITK